MKNIFLGFLFLTATAKAEILFEGYYKVSQAKKHIGFVIQRNEIDAKTKNGWICHQGILRMKNVTTACLIKDTQRKR